MATVSAISHLVSVPPGSVLLSDMIISSGMLSEDGVPAASGGSGAGPSGSAAGQEDGEFGVDPNLDPELAMVSSARTCLVNRILWVFLTEPGLGRI